MSNKKDINKLKVNSFKNTHIQSASLEDTETIVTKNSDEYDHIVSVLITNIIKPLKANIYRAL